MTKTHNERKQRTMQQAKAYRMGVVKTIATLKTRIDVSLQKLLTYSSQSVYNMV